MTEKKHISAEMLTLKWITKELTEQEITDYLICNLGAEKDLSLREIEVVTWNCFAIYQWSVGQVSFLGSFLKAVVDNDLGGAIGRADELNQRALSLYVRFLYNVAPSDYKNRSV